MPTTDHRPRDVRRYPRGKVVAILPKGAAEGVLAALRAAGVAATRIDLASGQADAQRVRDETARGVLCRLTHLLTPGEEFVQRERYLGAMREGESVVRVSLPDPSERRRVARLIASRGGYFLNYYGAWTVERLSDL